MPTSATNSRARLNRDELHQLRWLLGLVLVLLAFWTLFGLEFSGVIWRWLFFGTAFSALLYPRWPAHIPGWVRRWALIIGGCLLFVQFIATHFDILSALVLMVSLLTLSRSLQYRRIREDWQLVLLCLFIIVLSGVLTLSLLFALQILLFAIVAMALLFVMNLVERDSGRELTGADWKNFHWPHYLRRLREAVNLRQLARSVALFAALVLVSTLIFISIPRYQFEQGWSFGGQQGISGFHTDIDYSKNSIAVDDSIALRVDVPPGVRFATPPYWRMIVLDEYRNNGFRLSNMLQHSSFSKHITFPDATFSNPGKHLPGASQPPGVWTFYLEGNVSEYLPILGPFDSLTFSSAQDFWRNTDVEFYRTNEPSIKVLGYEIRNMDMADAIPAVPADLDPKLTRENVDKQDPNNLLFHTYPMTYLGLPVNPGDQATLKKIVNEQILRGENLTLNNFIQQTILYLQNNHVASLDVNLSEAKDGQDFLVKWLNTPKSSGWCEYYAGSFVLLARAAGYPARIAAGYRGATYNTNGNYYFVRQSEAHAWVEILDRENKRWLRVDPTPGAVAFAMDHTVDPTAPALLSQVSSVVTSVSGFSAYVDSLRMIWYRRVINFDQTDQQELAVKAGEYGKTFAVSVGQWFTARWQYLRSFFSGPVSTGRLVSLDVLTVLLALAWFGRAYIRNWWLRVSGSGLLGRMNGLSPVRANAGRWLRRFQPAWQARASDLPAAEHAAWNEVRLNLLALRYGPLDSLPDPVGTFRRAKMLLRSEHPRPPNSFRTR